MPSRPRRHPPAARQGSAAIDRTHNPSQALFRGMFDNAPVGIYWSTPEGQLLIANQEMARILGYDSPDELLHLNLTRDVYLRPADRSRLVDLYTDNEEPQTAEVEWKRKDSSPIWVQIRTRTVREGRARPLYFESFVLDVTRRKRTEEELRASQDRFAKAFRASPAAIAISRRSDGVLVDVNDTWLEMFGLTREAALGRSAVELGLIDAAERAMVIRRLEQEGRLRGAELRVRTRVGERDVLYCGEMLDLGRERCVITLALDVTERERVEHALRESEERLRLVGRATMKDVIWDWDVATDTLHWGATVELAFGYKVEDLGSSYGGWRERVHPDDVQRVAGSLSDAQAGTAESWSSDYRFRRADGQYASVLDRCYIVRDSAGKAVRMVGSLMDVSESRRAQEEFRALAARLQSTREDERKRLSRELHDELGQVLTALKIDLSHLRRALPESDTASLDRLQGMKGLLDRATAETHRMAMELRPAILDDLGLVSAVRWLVDDFTRRVGVPCELTLENLREPLPGDLATAIFRIVQEALTNIARHAAASHVDVRLVQDAQGITIRVSDDGKGMPRGTGDREERLGLLGLRERAAQLGGDVTVRSRRDRGTAVTARVPLPLS